MSQRRATAPGELEEMIGDLAPWLAAEYAAVHGVKAPRPALSPARLCRQPRPCGVLLLGYYLRMYSGW
jgi:hypothetical protein